MIIATFLFNKRRKKLRGSDGAEELIKLGLGVRVHADDDDKRNEPIVSDDFSLFHGPSAPLFQTICC